MPRGPRGEYRPADPMSRAVMIGQIATGQIPDDKNGKRRFGPAAQKARQARFEKARRGAETPTE